MRRTIDCIDLFRADYIVYVVQANRHRDRVRYPITIRIGVLSGLISLTPPAVPTSGVTMLRLDRMPMNGAVGRPLVNISVNWVLVGNVKYALRQVRPSHERHEYQSECASYGDNE